jgi:hypothetical protein
LSSAALAYAYEIFQPTGILLIVGAVLVGVGAVVLWSDVLKDRGQPNPKSARYIRLTSYLSYPLSLTLIGSFSITLGWRYIAAARPMAFAIFRVSTIGTIILLLVFMVVLWLWQSSLKALEQSEL